MLKESNALRSIRIKCESYEAENNWIINEFFLNENEPKIISNGINFSQHVFVYTKMNTLYSFGR